MRVLKLRSGEDFHMPVVRCSASSLVTVLTTLCKCVVLQQESAVLREKVFCSTLRRYNQKHMPEVELLLR